MRRPSRRIAPYLALVAGCAVQLLGASPQASNAAASQASTHRTVLNKYCVSCHNDRLRTAGLTLEKADIANLAGEAALWEKVLEKARNVACRWSLGILASMIISAAISFRASCCM